MSGCRRSCCKPYCRPSPCRPRCCPPPCKPCCTVPTLIVEELTAASIQSQMVTVNEILVAPQIRDLYSEIDKLQTQITNMGLSVAKNTNHLEEKVTVTTPMGTTEAVPAILVPPPVNARKVTLNNNTGVSYELWTANNQNSVTTKLATLSSATSNTFIFNIPDVDTLPPPNNFWSGNFALLPIGSAATDFNGISLAEMAFNVPTVIKVPPPTHTEYRDIFDISNVPPGIGSGCNNGPRSLCVDLSCKAGYKQQQAFGFNVGVKIVPPSSSILPVSVSVTGVSPNGSSPQTIGYPNDTAYPKQQTILNVAPGNYTVNFTGPLPAWPGSSC